MSESEKIESTYFPNKSDIVLEKIFYNVINDMYESNSSALFGELNQKYLYETRLIKSTKDRFGLINAAHRSFKKLKSKISMKSMLYQRMVDTEIVEKILDESCFKIGNFTWSIRADAAEDAVDRRLLANCLADYDTFKDAIDRGLIHVVSEIRIHDQIDLDLSELNEEVVERIQNEAISFHDSLVEVPNYTDDEITELIDKYKRIHDELSDDDDEDDMDPVDAEDVINTYNYFVMEYVDELRSITFRLYCVYLYFYNRGIKLLDIDFEGQELFQRLYHYYCLQDSPKGFRIDDDYLNEYDDLTQFYRMHIHYLRLTLVESLNECGIKETDTPKSNIPALNYNELTRKLVLSLKYSQKNE